MIAATSLSSLAFADFHFLAIADWGGLPIWPWASPAQRRVAQAMGDLAEQHSSAFVVSLGDHFYFHGVKSEDDPRWRRSFERVYDHPALSAPGFWRCVAGNHDHDGNVRAQLNYASRPESRWYFPALQHAWRSELRDEAGTAIDFVLVDTSLLCGMPGGQPAPETGDPAQGSPAAAWAWVEDALGAATGEYLVVGGHYPIESPSGHGPTACLRERLLPLLTAHRATVYLSGHDHALFHVSGGEVHMHGVGAGLVTSRSAKHAHTITPRSRLRFHHRGSPPPANLATGGFAGVSVSASGMTVSHYDQDGALLYAHTALPRRPAPRPKEEM